MFFHHNGNLAWLSIAKNACTSWMQVFDDLGWEKEDLHKPKTDISQLKFFGFLRSPDQRHTMGVVEYLERYNLLPTLYSDEHGAVLAAGVFDEHSYAISHLVPDSIRNSATFFIIDGPRYNYEILVKNFLAEHGVLISVPLPRLNTKRPNTHAHRQHLHAIKQQRIDIQNQLMKNFLEPDQLLYSRHMEQQHIWARPDDNHSRR